MVPPKIKLKMSTSNSPSSSIANTPSAINPPALNISPFSHSNTQTHTSRSSASRSASPERPPVSPITPTLQTARLASLPTTNGFANANSNLNTNVDLRARAQNGSTASEAHTSGQPQRRHIGGKNIEIMNRNRPFTESTNMTSFPPQLQHHPGAQAQLHAQREIYTHAQQAPRTAMQQPKPKVINFDENPDVLAMRSTISILQLQARNAERDMVALQRIKERAAEDPEGFVRSLREGNRRESEENARRNAKARARGRASGAPVDGQEEEEEEESSSDEDEEFEMEVNNGVSAGDANLRWEKLPTAQNIVRCPPVNWAKYGVMGESLDRLHGDQIRRPSQGNPATINADGSTTHKFGDGEKREYVGMKPLGLNEVLPKPKKKKVGVGK